MCASVLVHDGHVEVMHLQMDSFLSCFSLSLLFLKPRPVLSLKFTIPTVLASGNPPPLQSTCFCPIVLGVTGLQGHINLFFFFSVGAGDLISGPHICLVGSLLTDISAALCIVFVFNVKCLYSYGTWYFEAVFIR